jgi:hypothetical protein
VSQNPYGVRRATPTDIDSLMLFVPQVLTETTLLPLSHIKVELLIERCAYQRGGSIAGIIDGVDGQIDASVGMCFTESETSDEPYIMVAWCGLHPSVRRAPPDPNDPRAHYGKKLFDFARWCHAGLEEAAGRPILVRFDMLTREFLGPKMGLYQRNLMQVGATFAFGASGAFKPQDVPAEALAA